MNQNYIPKKGDLVQYTHAYNEKYKYRKQKNQWPPPLPYTKQKPIEDHPLYGSLLVVVEEEQKNNFGRVKVFSQKTGTFETVWLNEIEPVE